VSPELWNWSRDWPAACGGRSRGRGRARPGGELSDVSPELGVLGYSGWSHTAEGWAATKSSNVLQTIPKEYVDAMKKKFKLK